MLDLLKKIYHEGFYTIALAITVHNESKGELLENMDEWSKPIECIDTLVEYTRKSKQADATRFGISKHFMGEKIFSIYESKGIYMRSIFIF